MAMGRAGGRDEEGVGPSDNDLYEDPIPIPFPSKMVSIRLRRPPQATH